MLQECGEGVRLFECGRRGLEWLDGRVDCARILEIEELRGGRKRLNLGQRCQASNKDERVLERLRVE